VIEITFNGGFSHQFHIKEDCVSHRYKVREIAQQSGLSEATVDRVLHNRANVRESTRREVAQGPSVTSRSSAPSCA